MRGQRQLASSGGGLTRSERTDRLPKIGEYARVDIPQYWIVEHAPRLALQVLTLTGGACTAARWS